jgi:hypothetical protein
MSGITKLMTAGGGGVALTPASSIASDVTVNVPSQNCTLGIQGPAFSAYAGSTTNLISNTYVKVVFDTEEFDTNNNFASSRFTPTVAGYYQINGGFSVNTNGTVICVLYKNGSANKSGNITTVDRCYLNAVVYMNGTTDYLEIYGYAISYSPVVSALQTNTYFNGCLVRAA